MVRWFAGLLVIWCTALPVEVAAVDERPPSPIQIRPSQDFVEDDSTPQPSQSQERRFKPVRYFLAFNYDIFHETPRFHREVSKRRTDNKSYYRVKYTPNNRIREYIQYDRQHRIQKLARFYYRRDENCIAGTDCLSRVLFCDSFGRPRELYDYIYHELRVKQGQQEQVEDKLIRIDHYQIVSRPTEAFIVHTDRFASTDMREYRSRQREDVEAKVEHLETFRRRSLDRYGDYLPYENTEKILAEAGLTQSHLIHSEPYFRYDSVGTIIEQVRFFYNESGELVQDLTVGEEKILDHREYHYNERGQNVRTDYFVKGGFDHYILKYYDTAGEMYAKKRCDTNDQCRSLAPIEQ